jgi:phage baseplate assembly protein W
MADVSATSLTIKWAPNEAEEVVQNVLSCIVTQQGDVPGDPDLGIETDTVDLPQSVGAARLQAAIVSTVKKHEPRATVKKVFFEADETGWIRPKVRIE